MSWYRFKLIFLVIFYRVIKWQYLRFAIVGAIGTLVSAAILYSLTEWCNVYYMVAFIVGTIAGSITNYLLSKRYVFTGK